MFVQGRLNKKEIQLNLCKINSILIFIMNSIHLTILNHAKLESAVTWSAFTSPRALGVRRVEMKSFESVKVEISLKI